MAFSRRLSPARFDLAVDDGDFPVRLYAGNQERIAAHVVEHGESLLTLGNQMMSAVAGRDEADDRGHGAHPVQFLRIRLIARLGL